MRKTLVLLTVLAVLASLAAVPAVAAGKEKKVHDSFSATLAPFPKNETLNEYGFERPGCSSGEEGVHWVAHEFKAPGKGELRFYMEDFTGDHDIYLFLSETTFLRGDSAQVGQELAPPEEEITAPLKKGQTVTLVACNWLGDPEVVAHYEGTFK